MLLLQNIRKIFNPHTPDEIQALQDINLTIEKGSFVVVIGTNGSGKSTLLNAITGSLLIDSGKIVLNNIDITPLPAYRRSMSIGQVFQNPFQGTISSMSIAENFALYTKRTRSGGLRIAVSHTFKKELRERISSLGMGLEDRLDNTIESLSGGQRQALTLLMAAWSKPALLLLDEHTAALDPKSADLVIRLTEEIISRDKLTTIMVTHSMQQGAALGDRLIMMHKGQIVHDFQGVKKRRLRIDDLLSHFEEMRRGDQLDESAAAMLSRLYV